MLQFVVRFACLTVIMADSSTVAMSVSAFAEDAAMLYRPCVDCGRRTYNYCEGNCLARRRVPTEGWAAGQITPHCEFCEQKYVVCHFCRKCHWITPPVSGDLLNAGGDGIEVSS